MFRCSHRASSRPSPRRRVRVFAALASVLALVATACSTDGSEGVDVQASPRAGGVLRVTIPADPVSLDPFSTPSYAVAYGNVLSALYDPLVWANPSTGTITPHIAESLTPDNRDARVWTLAINPNVTFSDGQPFDAAAVKANWEANARAAQASGLAAAAVGLELTVTAPLRLSIELPEPNANFDRLVASSLNFVASPRALADPAKLETNPVGAGPFVLAERVPGQRLTLRKNPRYWQPGRPHLDQVDFLVAQAGQSLPAAIAADTLDLASFSDPVQAQEAANRELGVVPLELGGGLMLLFNTRRPPFDNPAARRAVVQALSAKEINRRFYQGLGTPAKGIFGSTTPLASIQLAQPENDIEAARTAFARLTADGSRPFRFTLLSAGGAQGPASLSGYVQEQVQQFMGVRMEIQEADTATLIRRTLAADFDVAVSGMWMNDPEPMLYDFLQPGSPVNTSGYSHPEVSAAMTAGRLAVDADARRTAYTRVQVRLHQDVPFWVYQEAANTVVFARRVTGVQAYADGLVLFDRIGLRG